MGFESLSGHVIWPNFYENIYLILIAVIPDCFWRQAVWHQQPWPPWVYVLDRREPQTSTWEMVDFGTLYTYTHVENSQAQSLFPLIVHNTVHDDSTHHTSSGSSHSGISNVTRLSTLWQHFGMSCLFYFCICVILYTMQKLGKIPIKYCNNNNPTLFLKSGIVVIINIKTIIQHYEKLQMVLSPCKTLQAFRW